MKFLKKLSLIGIILCVFSTKSESVIIHYKHTGTQVEDNNNHTLILKNKQNNELKFNLNTEEDNNITEINIPQNYEIKTIKLDGNIIPLPLIIDTQEGIIDLMNMDLSNIDKESMPIFELTLDIDPIGRSSFTFQASMVHKKQPINFKSARKNY